VKAISRMFGLACVLLACASFGKQPGDQPNVTRSCTGGAICRGDCDARIEVRVEGDCGGYGMSCCEVEEKVCSGPTGEPGYCSWSCTDGSVAIGGCEGPLKVCCSLQPASWDRRALAALSSTPSVLTSVEFNSLASLASIAGLLLSLRKGARDAGLVVLGCGVGAAVGGRIGAFVPGLLLGLILGVGLAVIARRVAPASGGHDEP
jgi:hypothetical protein